MQIEELVEAAARRMAVADGQNPDKLSHNSFEWWRHYVPMARAAIEATLSAAEPVVYVSRKSLEQLNAEGSHVAVQTLIHRVPLRSGNGVPLFAGPLETTPSVAVKALQDYVLADFTHLTDAQALSGPYIVKRIKDRFASFALSAQVQDESDIVDCLSAGKPFVFDPATNFCHADDGGAPEHGIKYIPAEQVQDVAGWQPIETAKKDRTIMLLWSSAWLHPIMGYWSTVQNGWLEYASRDTKANIATHWMPLPAAPAKQEG